MARTVYSANATMLEARSEYFEQNEFGPNGGYDEPTVEIEVFGTRLRFPNTEARKRAVRYHDLHHVVTQYATDMAGESEIAAWELASNCRGHVAAWVLNFGAFTYGLITCPRRVRAAFVRGRHTRNLYDRRFDDALLGMPVGQLQAELGLDRDTLEQPRPASAGDRVWFAAAVLTGLMPVLAILAGVAFGLTRLLGA